MPDYAMGFNVVCSMLLVLLGSPVRIYIISNGGYQRLPGINPDRTDVDARALG